MFPQDEFGVWNLFLPDNEDGTPKIAHKSRFKIAITTSTGEETVSLLEISSCLIARHALSDWICVPNHTTSTIGKSSLTDDIQQHCTDCARGLRLVKLRLRLETGGRTCKENV